MNDAPVGLRSHYLSLFTELTSSRATRRTAAEVGRVLETAGALLRRQTALGIDAADIEGVLGSLAVEELDAWAGSFDPGAWETRFARAAEESLESLLPDEPSESGTWAGWAMDGIQAREAIASVLHALEALERIHAMTASSSLSSIRLRIAGRVRSADRALRSKARWFVGLNRARRAERDSLDPVHRAQSWWYSDRSECDELGAFLAGTQSGGVHLQTCPECARDVEIAEKAGAPRTRHLTPDELWNYDLGLLSSGERAVAERHAQGCAECAKALRALAEGEEAIAEVDEAPRLPPRPVSASPVGPRARVREEPSRTLLERTDCRVALVRRAGRAMLRIEPRGRPNVAAAVASIRGAQIAEARGAARFGFDLELGDEGAVLGQSLRLVLKAPDGRVVYDGDLAL